MFQFLKKLIPSKAPEDPGDYLAWALERGKPTCPDCRKADLWPGPSGGMSTNFACPNCLARFNTAIIDAGHLDGGRSRIETFGFERTGEVDQSTLQQLFRKVAPENW